MKLWKKLVCYALAAMMIVGSLSVGFVFADTDTEAAANTEITDVTELAEEPVADEAAEAVPVTLTQGETTKDSITVSWNGEASTEYQLFYGTSDADLAEVTVAAGAFEATVDGLAAETEYVFVLKANGEEAARATFATAADKTVAGLAATTTYNSATLTWTAEAGKTYVIYVNGTKKGTATEGTFKVTGLTSKKTYTIKVAVEGEESVFAEVQATTKALSAPTVKTSYNTNNSIQLTWNAVPGAKKYKVYRNGTLIKTTTSKTFLDESTSLKKGTTYKYQVAAADSSATGTKSKTVKKKAKKTYTSSKVHTMYYSGHIIRTGAQVGGGQLFANSKRTKRIGTVPVGTKVTTYEPANGSLKIKFKRNGKTVTGWVNKERVKKTKGHFTTRDYTTAAKEKFVKGYSSKTNQLVWCNHYTQQVNIFKRASKGAKWKLVKTYDVSTGKIGRETPRSKYYTIKTFARPAKDAQKHPNPIYNHHELGWFYSTHKVLYVVHFSGRNSFHTPPIHYKNKSTRDAGQRTLVYKGAVFDNTIGHPGSVGCTRVSVEGSKYIYDNCKKGARVIQW